MRRVMLSASFAAEHSTRQKRTFTQSAQWAGGYGSEADLLVPPSAIASLTYAVAVKIANRRYFVTIRETGIVTTWFAASWTSMSKAQ